MDTSSEHNEKSHKAIRIVYFRIILVFGIAAIAILGKASYISFVEGDRWMQYVPKVSHVVIPAMRGNIYSCHGELMAASEYEYRMYIDFWADGMSKDTLMRYIDPLSQALAKKFPEKTSSQYKSHILKGWKKRLEEEKLINSGKKNIKKTREYRLLDRKLNYMELRDLKNMPFFHKRSIYQSGLMSRRYVRRINPYGTLALRTIGDIYNDYPKGGKNGLELQYDSLLRGIPGTGIRKRINGRTVEMNDIHPVNGHDIVSTIDINIQDITEKALLGKLREIDAESGTAVVMEVATGEIKAITNMERTREGAWAEARNHAVADETEPGSTFKVASMMVALEDGVVRPTDSINTFDGKFPYADRTITDHNHHRGGYGMITAAQSILYSSNIGVARIILKAYEHQPGKYVEGIYKLGLHEPLDLEIPGAGRSKIRKPGNKAKYWSKTTLPWMSFGYETQIPPIYMLTFFNAIANDGKMLKPSFVKEIRQDDNIKQRREPLVIREKICSPSTLNTIRRMLLDVVEDKSATGHPVKSEHVLIAGKTGTAQIAEGGSYKNGGTTHQVSFCGYFPANRPQYSCIVVIRKPRNGYPSGGTMSGGVFKRIAEEVNARINRQTPQEAPPDTLHSPLPVAQAGMYQPLEYLVKKLDVPYRENKIRSPWVSADVQENEIRIKTREITETLVPDVKDMGAKDAVYLLEKQGLRVNLSGRGSVCEQSVPPGSHVVKGQTVRVVLR
ncbi:MAG: transpeptidase family protein [Dysgonamonadaceae bacterium]|jgi:cell division protein FtsI (penicillin-binding protein 3)|nr:transpeptidase family protein [Dysgonamonadaceae bacterium]